MNDTTTGKGPELSVLMAVCSLLSGRQLPFYWMGPSSKDSVDTLLPDVRLLNVLQVMMSLLQSYLSPL